MDVGYNADCLEDFSQVTMICDLFFYCGGQKQTLRRKKVRDEKQSIGYHFINNCLLCLSYKHRILTYVSYFDRK